MVLRTAELTGYQAETLRTIQSEETSLDFWKDPIPGMAAEIMAPAEQLQELKDRLEQMNLDYSTKVADVQK